MSNTEQRTSLIKSLLTGDRQKEIDEAADQELDVALMRLSRAFDDNEVAVAAIRRRQSSGTLKLVSIPEAASDAE